MKLLARLDAVAGRMNPYLAIVAIALGIIDLTVLVAQQATADAWRYQGAARPAHATVVPGHQGPPHRPAIL